jgi:hypothetical protein
MSGSARSYSPQKQSALLNEAESLGLDVVGLTENKVDAITDQDVVFNGS